MFEFKYDENFEPSSNTKQWWLYTHKTERSFSGVTLPGLFQTTYYEWQMLGFIMIFLLEGIATYWCYQEGVIITAILASMFVDIVLAIVAHIFQKDICKKKNELVYEDDVNLGAIKRNLASKQLKQRFFYLLIFISALFKIFWFFSVYGLVDATTLFIMTCYLIGAILHITCTGYAIFTFIFNRKLSKEYNKYLDSKHQMFAFDETLPLRSKLSSTDLKEAEVGRHMITKGEDGHFYLETFGILTDSQLWALIGKQIEPEQKRALAVDGVKHQMLILQQDPTGAAKSESQHPESLGIVTGSKVG